MNESAPNTEMNSSLVRYASYTSVFIALILIIMKLGAYISSHSVAILASLIDSLLDLVASFVNLIAIRHALTPADEEHRFGHGKAEPLAGLAQSAFIAGSALFLILEAGDRLINPQEIEHGMVAITVMAISTIMAIALVRFQQYVVNKTGSIAIRADSLHYFGDVLANISVIVALVLSIYFGWQAADSLFAFGVAIYVLFNAWKIVKVALDQLMDRELPDEKREEIIRIATTHPEVRSLHELRTRTSGFMTFIQMHLVMDPKITLEQAHSISDEVEAELKKVFQNSEVIIHEDPEGLEQNLNE